MKILEIIAAIGTIIGVLGSLIELINKKVRGKPVFNRTTLLVLTYIATLGLGVIVGSVTSSYYAKNGSAPLDGGKQISQLERTIDFLKGKSGKLSEKIVKDENELKVPQQGHIILFDHINYRGHRCYIFLEDDVSDLNLYGFGNTVSSIKVEGDVRARIYNGVDYSGPPSLIESDMPSLPENWNDRILSVSVEGRPHN